MGAPFGHYSVSRYGILLTARVFPQVLRKFRKNFQSHTDGAEKLNVATESPISEPILTSLDASGLVNQLQALQLAFESSERRVFEKALEESEQRYRDLFDNVLTGVYRTSPKGEIVLANPALARMLGYSPDEKVIIRRQNPEHFELVLRTEGHIRGVEDQWQRKDGCLIAVRETARAVYDDTGSVAFFEGIVEDITSEKRAEQFDRGCRRILEMVARNADLDDIFDSIADLLEAQSPGILCSIMIRREDRVFPVRTSRFYDGLAKVGLPIGTAYGPSSYATATGSNIVIHDVDQSDVLAQVRELSTSYGLKSAWSTPIGSKGIIHGAITMFRTEPYSPDSHELEMTETASRLAAVAIEHRSLYENLHRQATKDRLTGLPNRFVFEETLLGSLATYEKVALLCVDLDRFKEVNDSLGHHIGDRLIQQAAIRMSTQVGDATVFARTGGDEFAIVLPNADRKQAEACAMRLLATLQSVFEVDDYELFVTGSIGIAVYPDDSVTAVELQQKADAAMYRAKNRGKNGYAFYEEQLEKGAKERLETETSLRRALQNGELTLFYQPQVDLDGRLRGMEALLRWEHPKRGLISPADFIPLAEETGLIVPIGSWVIREACRQCACWQKAGFGSVKVAVNVSALQFYFSDLVEIVRSALQASAVPSECLELELTESLIMRNSEDSTRELQRLRALGVTVAIDDFGTGYSSLSYLQKLPVDLLKIDRSFLQDVNAVGTCALIQAITALAHSLGLRVTAEGVETESQLNSIRKIGVDMAQGYLFGRPMPSEMATGYLQNALSVCA